MRHPLSALGVAGMPQAPGRTPRSAGWRASGTTPRQGPLRCPGAEDTPPRSQGGPPGPTGREGGNVIWPQHPGHPGHPGPRPFPWQPGPAPEPRQNPAMQPARVWFDPAAGQQSLYDRLLARRIVMAHGTLDGAAATRLCAQLLTLDAEGTAPIRLELQNLDAELPAVLSVMGILDVVRGPVSAYVSGRIQGPALGILLAARHRWAYPNSFFVLSEPRVSFDGTVTAVTAREEQTRAMVDELFGRIAEVTGHELDQVRADARQDRLFDVAEATAYGLVEGQAAPRGLPGLPGLAGTPGKGHDGGRDGGTGTGHD
jgi:ATP-dependent Clp protease protease subunit